MDVVAVVATFWPLVGPYLGATACQKIWQHNEIMALLLLIGGVVFAICFMAASEVPRLPTVGGTTAAVLLGLSPVIDYLIGPPVVKSKARKTEVKPP